MKKTKYILSWKKPTPTTLRKIGRILSSIGTLFSGSMLATSHPVIAFIGMGLSALALIVPEFISEEELPACQQDEQLEEVQDAE